MKAPELFDGSLSKRSYIREVQDRSLQIFIDGLYCRNTEVTPLQCEMVFLTFPFYSRYRMRILNFLFLSNFGCIQRILRVLQDFSTTYEDLIGSIFQPWQMASYIRALREQNAIKFSALLTEKFHCACYPYALNELNLARKYQQNMKKLRSYGRTLIQYAMSEKNISRYCPFKSLSQANNLRIALTY